MCTLITAVISFQLPVRVPVAHRVVARVLLVLLVHLEADSLDAALLHLVLVAAVLAGGQRRLSRLVDRRLPAVPLELRGLRDRRQEAEENKSLIQKCVVYFRCICI